MNEEIKRKKPYIISIKLFFIIISQKNQDKNYFSYREKLLTKYVC